MSATLVVSDLHLGAHGGCDLLGREDLRAPLIEALEGIDRLVLLGDALELRQAPLRVPLGAARPFFEAIGRALGAGGEIVLTPGNHDHALVAPWLERRHRDGAAVPLGLEERAALEPGDAAALLAAWSAPARFTLAYPGVWLRDDVYAMHGHYLDRHTTVPTFERLAAGAMGRLTGGLPADGRAATPDDYERALAPIYAWSYALAQHASEDAAGTANTSVRVWQALTGAGGRRALRRAALLAAFPVGVAAVNRLGLGPVRADVRTGALGRAGVRAMGEAVERLRVPARHVIYGHTHRAGPWPHDDLHAWASRSGVRLHNTGTWVYERHFLGHTPYGSPYWPGTAIRVEDDRPPRLLRLLGERGHAELGAR